MESADMKTIIEMAREAGFAINELHCSPPIITFVGQEGVIEAFAALVRAEEREACAKVCETLADDYYDCTGVANAITAAIRARGQA
jgi:hypothetical protein